MGGEVLVTHYGAPAREQLAALIAAAKGADPLAPVTVLTTTVEAGLSIRRRLVSSGGGGLVNVRFALLTRLAEQIGAADLAAQGRRPLTSVSLAAATRAALDEEPGVLARVAGHASTVPSLLRTFRDLRELSPADLDRLQRQRSGVVRDTLRLFRRVRASCEGGWYDGDDLYEAAAMVVRSGRAGMVAIGEIVVHLPEALRFAELDLLDALAARTTVTVTVGLLGEEVADRLAMALLGRVSARASFAGAGASFREPAAARADDVAAPQACERSLPDIVISAPDPDEEVRSAIRLLLDKRRAGTRLDACAVLYPVASPYALLLAEQLDAASLPWSGPSPRPLASTRAGRVLLGAIELARDGTYPREAVISWLACGPVLDGAGHALPVSLFDRLSCDAGIVGGPKGWLDGLRWYRQRAERAQVDGRIDEEALARLVAPITTLERVMAELFDICGRAVACGTWCGLQEWAVDLLDRYLGPVTRREEWTPEETAGEQRIHSLLREIAGLDELDAAPRLARFERAVAEALSRPSPRVGAFGSGVTVGPLRELAPIERELVVIVGAIEGNLLTGEGADPLVPASAKAAVGADGAGPRRGADADRHAWATALAAAQVRVCTYPRGDQRSGRRTTRSRLISDSPAMAAAAVSGRVPVVEKDVGSFAGALQSPGERVSATDYELSSLLAWADAHSEPTGHFLARHEQMFGRGLEVMGLRAGDSFSRFDGHVGALQGARDVPGVPEGESFSPTRLQTFATCPFSYLLANVLGVERLEGPEQRVTINALERGSLIHEVLERFGRESQQATQQQDDGVETDAAGWAAGRPATPADEERLRAILQSVCVDYERRGLTGKRLLWGEEKSRIWRALWRFVVADSQRMQDLGTVPLDFELKFGLSDSPPVEVAAGRRLLRFRGMIDRIDRASDGSLVVADYKSGSGSRYEQWQPEEDPVDRGTLLQLPLYALAAGQAHGAPGAVTRAEYRLVERPPELATVQLTIDARTIERMTDVITTVTGQIEAGCFPARPGQMEFKGPKNCRYCDYDPLCSPARAASWVAKRSSPQLSPYVQLAEGDPGE